MKLALLSALSLVFLYGCAGAVPWNQQGYAGINMVEAKFQVPEGEAGPTSLRVVGGKEQELIAFKATLPDGTITEYSARGVKAFDGQALRAAVEKAVSEDVKAVAPGIVEKVVGAVSRVVTP
jgi:hypothetical protein